MHKTGLIGLVVAVMIIGYGSLAMALDGGALDKWMIDYEGLQEEGLPGPVVVIKFRRQDIANALAEKGEMLDTEFILKGVFDDGTAPASLSYEFEGKDSVTKIISDETPATEPPQQPKEGKK